MSENRDFFAHETAIIDQPAKIGKGTKIWHFSHIMQGCEIGENCSFGQNVLVSTGVKVGNNVKVQNNVSMYTGVICEDDVFLGPSMVFTNVINPRSAVARKSEYRETYLEKGVSVGANATLICGIRLGKFAFIGAGTVVTKSYPPYALVIGNPGRQSGWMSEYGQRLHFGPDNHATCTESGQRYKIENNLVTKIA